MRQLWIGGAAFAAAISLVWLVGGGQNDFIYDWFTAHAVVHGLDPYQPIGELAANLGLINDQPPEWIHPRIPGGLIVQSPLGLVPFDWTYVTGRLLTVGSAFFLAWVVARLADFRLVHAFVAVPVLLLVWPFSNVLLVSQTGFLVAGLIGWAWLLGDRYLAGVPLSVAVVLKMWPWLLIPGLWLSGRRKAAYGAAGGFVVLNLVGLPLVSLDGISRMLADAETFRNYSLSATLGTPTWLAAVLALAVLVWISHRTELTYAWAVGLALLAAPFVWQHYLPALLVPLVLQFRPGQTIPRIDPSLTFSTSAKSKPE